MGRIVKGKRTWPSEVKDGAAKNKNDAVLDAAPFSSPRGAASVTVKRHGEVFLSFPRACAFEDAHEKAFHQC